MTVEPVPGWGVSLGRAALVAIALLLLAITAARLALLNADLFRRAEARKQRGEKIAVDGSLIGINGITNAEWKAKPDDSSRAAQFTVLFAIVPMNATEQLNYWREVASEIAPFMPKVEFVGVCDKGQACRNGLVRYDGLTILSYMDLGQMHALSVAKMNGLSLLYQDQTLVATPLVGNKSQLIREIVYEVEQAIRPVRVDELAETVGKL